MFRISSTSTSTLISQFPVLQESALQVSDVPADQAHRVIAGFTICNDVSVRDWQFRSPTMMMGKGFDTHGPLGPWIVTPDEIGDPHELAIRCYVNGEKRQDTNTKHMIFDCFQQIAHLTTAFTLESPRTLNRAMAIGVGLHDGANGNTLSDVVTNDAIVLAQSA